MALSDHILPDDGAERQRLERAQLVALSERYRASLLRFFERRVKTRLDVEDLVQEVFLRLVRRVDLVSIEHVQGYLFEVAANVLRDRVRHGETRAVGRHDEYREDAHALEDFSPERVLIGRQTVGRVAKALYELPERSRMAFVLHRFEGMHHPEIARRLGVSVSSVEKYIMQALAHIKRRLDREP
jgi:RNA polymerase sigma factor (sigma-70 family)